MAKYLIAFRAGFGWMVSEYGSDSKCYYITEQKVINYGPPHSGLLAIIKNDPDTIEGAVEVYNSIKYDKDPSITAEEVRQLMTLCILGE